uniref:Uncharacterized protein n=1 Tax=Colobus angolensis palliatus TaxID=336983 RepID=A0A2K5HLW4_COLAP
MLTVNFVFQQLPLLLSQSTNYCPLQQQYKMTFQRLEATQPELIHKTVPCWGWSLGLGLGSAFDLQVSPFPSCLPLPYPLLHYPLAPQPKITHDLPWPLCNIANLWLCKICCFLCFIGLSTRLIILNVFSFV